ncbi:hypothetical protein CEUSTIGMA_g2468.t1 [Chlamydomonas eustigma]|uniref:Protein ENHANCED DISEASE RESISTANCE 2 C-terminal domain-containing protein n=1 Tax=Chlamydomonas eustigma TaxID=1157962 RepID=A0A250WWM7_9CHLO|nr:hypothetical protein CEUSTIGMA_g2468.t1 [Chlamydomonas eustigma]|eukprot:GAX75022.1 hypothetical protein CEUSTIGMA_g2468.t1 [Chlamydomonas eustigma]
MGSCCSRDNDKAPVIKGQNHQRQAHRENPPQSRHLNSPVLAQQSITSDGFLSCREEFSITDGSVYSVPCSPPGSPSRSSPHVKVTAQRHHVEIINSDMVHVSTKGGPSPVVQPSAASHLDESVEGDPSVASGQEDTNKVSTMGCGLLDVLTEMVSSDGGGATPQEDLPRNSKRKSNRKLLCAGSSLNRRDMSLSISEVSLCYEDVDGKNFKVRGLDYMKNRLKVHSERSIYRLISADMFSFDHKQDHIAQLVNLPEVPPPHHMTQDSFYPQLLIITLQLPTYAPSLWGGNGDGPGWSIVYYFQLSEDFNPDTFPNKKALGLFKRFVQNEKESDGTPTRDRFKLIPRAVNVAEWAEKGPLSTAEHKMLLNYNEKPILARPQQRYYSGHNYLEVDLDIHTYSYLARSALVGFMSRLSSVIWETCYVIQGNSADELPEQVLACARIYKTDFSKPRPFKSFVSKHQGPG